MPRMTNPGKPRVIALEEHYWDREVAATFDPLDGVRGAPGIAERLFDYADLRIKEMDEAGIDVQVLSHGAPATQRLHGETAVKLARGANDRLLDIIRAHPARFAGFACLPTAEPAAAADELERAVTKLGFKGAMVHGLTNGVFFDDKRFWPIFERAQALDVPLYIHPATPHPAVVDAYLKDYVKDFPALLSAGWGFTMETATQGIRLVLSGVFDAYPNVKIILGHLGESLPFLLWRINHALARPGNRASFSFRDYFCKHFWITTSGFFSNPALLCCVMEMGIDRILFSVDYPFVRNAPAAQWIPTIPLSPDDTKKLLSGNAERLLRLH
ncbi:MAG: amidohydrolase [Candidatus Rokubacteria bacterium]|nr:amidohydrolase [Candidatus Rokubacteria bacterium]